jgi:hypothetical protein
MTISQILVAVAVAVLGVGLNALVNIKIRFAPDAQTATRDLRHLVRTILIVVSHLFNLANLYLLVRAGLSSAPLTRQDVLIMILQGFAVTFGIVSILLHDIMKLIREMTKLHGAHVDVTKELLGAAQDAVRALKDPGGSMQ